MPGTDLCGGFCSAQVGSQVLLDAVNQLLPVTIGVHAHHLQATVVNAQQHVQPHVLCLKLVNVLLCIQRNSLGDTTLLVGFVVQRRVKEVAEPACISSTNTALCLGSSTLLLELNICSMRKMQLCDSCRAHDLLDHNPSTLC